MALSIPLRGQLNGNVNHQWTVHQHLAGKLIYIREYVDWINSVGLNVVFGARDLYELSWGIAELVTRKLNFLHQEQF